MGLKDRVLYHATFAEESAKILREGFKVSTEVGLDPVNFVWFGTSRERAWSYLNYWADFDDDKTEGVIITAKIPRGVDPDVGDWDSTDDMGFDRDIPASWITGHEVVTTVKTSAQNRRCEQCGRAMSPRQHRQSHPVSGRKVCNGCAKLNTPEWTNMTYSRRSRVAGFNDDMQAYDDKHNLCSGSGQETWGNARECHVCHQPVEVRPYGDEGQIATHQRPARRKQAGFPPAQEDPAAPDPAQDPAQDPAAPPADPAAPPPPAPPTATEKPHDGMDLAHCPFCGSGGIIGGSDGTVECQFCHKFFTVQIQPEFAAMPQTIDGVPYNIPGMPGAGPDAGGAQDQRADAAGEAQDQGDQLDEQPRDPNEDDGEEKADDNPFAKKDGPPKKKKEANPFAKGSLLITAEGIALEPEAYVQHLALAYADDRDLVLHQVKRENRR